jgi:IS30 family transposase
MAAHLTVAQREHGRRLRRRGLTVREIAKEINRATSSSRGPLPARGVEPRLPP